MNAYIKSVSKNLPSTIVLLKAGDSVKCPVDNNNYPMKEWTSRKESDVYDANWSNYAMLTGSASGIWVFDIDNKANNIDETLEWFYDNDFEPEEDAFTVKTPSGGYHIYFKYEPNIQFKRKYLSYNDIQSNGQCVIFIGSNYPKGAYELINDCPITHAPDFIIEAIKDDNTSFKKLSSNSSNESKDSEDEPEDEPVIETKDDKMTRITWLLKLLKKNRCIDYDNWLKVGMIIKNELGEEGFDLFNKFSQQDKETYNKVDKATRLYGEALIKNKWDSFKISKLLIGTLVNMAKEDSPKAFEKSKQQQHEENRIKEENKIKEEMKYINMFQNKDVFINRFEDNEFTMVKFLRHLDCTMFEDRDEAYYYIRDNLHKVCALIGINILLIKNDLICNSDQITFNCIETFGKDQLIKYQGMNPSKPITLYKVLFANRDFLCRYEKISTSIAYVGNNIQEFYVTRPYVGRKVEYKIEELEFILEFIKHTISNDDDEVYNSIINWLAWIVQFPDIKSGVVPVFISLAGGTGKTKFIEFMYKFVIGEHLYAPVQDVGGVTETQNKHLMGRKLVYVNEMATTREQFLSQFQKLKGLITEDMFKMKALFKDHIFVKNSLEFILTANNIDCIPQEKKQRRFFPIRFNNDRMNNFEYFGRFESITWNQEYGNKFYSYLMDIPNLTIASVRQFPKTKLSIEMLENQMSSFDSFMDDLFNHQLTNVVNNSIKESDNNYSVQCVHLYDSYVEYQKRFFASTKLITYRKFVSQIKSEDNEYNIVFNERKNGKDKAAFNFTLNSKSQD
jgi:hypothetical protein